MARLSYLCIALQLNILLTSHLPTQNSCTRHIASIITHSIKQTHYQAELATRLHSPHTLICCNQIQATSNHRNVECRGQNVWGNVMNFNRNMGGKCQQNRYKFCVLTSLHDNVKPFRWGRKRCIMAHLMGSGDATITAECGDSVCHSLKLFLALDNCTS